jgi:hypothetical protein
LQNKNSGQANPYRRRDASPGRATTSTPGRRAVQNHPDLAENIDYSALFFDILYQDANQKA